MHCGGGGDMLHRTPLYQEHVTMGAHLVEFAGWEMPLSFSGIVSEHEAVRASAGAFDVSHMANIVIRGPNAVEMVSRAFTNDIHRSELGKAKYTHMLTEKGHILDDMIVTRITDDEFLCVANASMRKPVSDVLRALGPEGAVEDISMHCAAIAIQGPKSREIVSRIFGDGAVELKPFWTKFVEIKKEWKVTNGAEGGGHGVAYQHIESGDYVFVSRTGYTGEEGFEIIIPFRAAPALWYEAIKKGEPRAAPIGLGARDTLRLEMGYLLSGQDFHGDRTTLETGYDWVIKWDHDFVGRHALEAQKAAGNYQRFVGLTVEGQKVPRNGYKIMDGGSVVGTVTSGTQSPTLKQGIALGYVDAAAAAPGKALTIDIRGARSAAKVVKPPFVRKK
ncbi:MAG: glycine cleavage system aminomethyltransferase GcvT [Euryarchaeota archaeon]|nr:glycine cleavage system aminomethyltransferase GcvT [Euryarchaeota archaeon]